MAARRQDPDSEQPGEERQSGQPDQGAQRPQGEGERPRQSRGQGQQHGQELDFESLREHGRALREAASGFREATQQALADAESMARTGVQDRPYTMLGAAFAAGWVLGGGVPLRLASLATGAVGRAALGLAAARLAEFQTNGGSAGSSGRKRQSEPEGGERESGARAEM